jgi:hypothetical protein
MQYVCVRACVRVSTVCVCVRVTHTRDTQERDTEGSIGQGLWRMIGYLLAGQQHRLRHGRRVWVVLNGLEWGLCCFFGDAEHRQISADLF